MGSLLQRKVKNGFAIGPQVPAAFYNATEHILDNLDVWGGHIERDGLNWTITMDEFLDTDGTPATAAGRWKTGEGAAPGTKTTYAARIWGNDTNNYPAVDLDAFTLKANDATGNKTVDWHNTKLHANDTANTEIFDWTESGDTNRGTYCAFSRGVKLDGEPQRFIDSNASALYADSQGVYFGISIRALADFGQSWASTSGTTAAGTQGSSMVYGRVYTYDTADSEQFDASAKIVHHDTSGRGWCGARFSASVNGDAMTAYVASSSQGSVEGFRCSDGTRRVSLLNSDTSAGDADVYVGGSGGGCTWGIRSGDKPAKFDAYVAGDSYADFEGYGQFGSHVNVDTSAGEYRVNGTRVVDARLSAVDKPTGLPTTTDTAALAAFMDTSAWGVSAHDYWVDIITAIKENQTAIDDIIDRLRAGTGHGLIADS